MKNLTRRPNGVWYVRKVVDGKVRRISTGQTDKKFAEKVARKILGDFDKGLVDDVIGARKAKIPTYGEVARNVIATVKHTNVYKYSLAATIAAWDDKRVDLLTATDCLTFLKTQLATGRSRNCIKQSVDLSSAVFNRAIADGVKMQNPWRLVPKKARPKAQPRDRVLSHEDEEKLLAELPPVINRIARVQLGAGLRIGEVLALVPKRDLDFANGFFRLSATKGEKPRSVPMFLDGSKAKDALLEQLAELGEPITSDKAIFGRHTQAHILHQFAAAVQRAGIARCTTHDLRRTFGTRMAVERNAPMKVLAGWMGHSNIQITAKFYAHLEDAESRRVAQEIAAKGPSKVVGISERAAAQ